jgi:YggT family protein
MLIIMERTLWFVTWAIQGIILGVILLMILRLISDGLDLNPFGWTSRTIRRFSDGMIMPVRGGLRRLGVEPKFAPLVVILLAILFGYFSLQLVSTLISTIGGVIESLVTGRIIAVIGFLLYGLLSIYLLLITLRIIFSWGQVSYSNRIMRFLVDTTEPLLGPLRRMIPPLGWIDISPIVAILIVWLFRTAIAGTLLSGASFRML